MDILNVNSFKDTMTFISSLDYWADKVAIVLPSHTHCGAEMVLALLSCRMRVVGLAPRLETMETLRSQLPNAYREKFQTHDCDFQSSLAIKAEVQRIKRKYGTVDLLILLQAQEVNDSLEEQDLSGYERQAQNGMTAFLEAARALALLNGSGRILTQRYRRGQQGAEIAELCLQTMSALQYS